MNVEITRIGAEECAVCFSLDVAETFEKRHRDVLRDIRKFDCSVKFRVRNFAQSSYINEQGKEQPMAIMTRDGFTFLVMGYRGEKAAQFKEAYIAQFNRMKQALRRKQIERAALKPVRRSPTDAIQAAGGDPWAYKHYTDLAYKSVTEQNASQLRQTRGADKTAAAVDYMTAEEIQQVAKRQEQFAVLLETGMDYQQIKALASA